MIVGVLEMRLAIYEATSLKDKRRVIKSFKDRIGSRFNVSIAEVDALDARQTGVLGVAMIANETRYVEGALSKIVDFVRASGRVSLVDWHIEYY